MKRRSNSRERRRNRERSRSRSRSRSRERSRERERRNERRDNNNNNNHNRERNREREERKERKQEKQQQEERHIWGNIGIEEEYNNLKKKERGEDIPEEDKEKPNFGLTGALAKDEITGNMYNGVLLKWTEPLDAAPPQRGWRIYIFKGDNIIDTLYLHRQSAYLFGRESRVADHVLNHPSCSSQHAVIQFRYVTDKSNELQKKRIIKPFIMDLQSTNFTFLNGDQIEDSRYYELKPKDLIKFGSSTREYVVIYDPEENSTSKKK